MKSGRAGGVGSLLRYDVIGQIGEGTYGYVYKARDKETNQIIALKRIIFQRDSSGFPLFAIREIKLLKSLQHPNIVSLLNIVSSKGCEDQEDEIKTATLARNGAKTNQQTDSYGVRCGNTYLVFEYIEHDVGGLIDIKHPFEIDQIRVIMKQLLEVLSFLHEKGILHRDIKTSNLLLTNRLQLKLADFGLAREIYPVPQNLAVCGLYGAPLSSADVTRPELTNNVITTWYRPPELLLGERRYTSAVDIWSAGCVMGEMFLSRPMFPGKTEVAQMELIIRATGVPTEESWPGVTELPLYSSLISTTQSSLASLQSYSFISPTLRTSYDQKISDPSLSFLERLLIPDPNKRLSARTALLNSYFHLCPEPTSIPPLDLNISCHEFETKSKRREPQDISLVSEDSQRSLRGNSETKREPESTVVTTSDPRRSELNGHDRDGGRGDKERYSEDTRQEQRGNRTDTRRRYERSRSPSPVREERRGNTRERSRDRERDYRVRDSLSGSEEYGKSSRSSRYRR